MESRSLPFAILGLLAAVAAHAGTPTALLGELVPPAEAIHTIRIDPATRYLNVTYRDTVRFLVNGQEFAYRFDGAESVTAIDLRRVAPAGTLDHRVEAYIGADPYGTPW